MSSNVSLWVIKPPQISQNHSLVAGSMGRYRVEVTKKPHNVGCIIWQGVSVWYPVKIEHSLQVNSVKYLLTLLVWRYSMVWVFLPSKHTMFFMWLYPFLRPVLIFFLPQWFISFMTKCFSLQFSFQVQLNRPLCLPGVWELQPCTEAAAELWGGGCICVHTPHYQVFIYCRGKGDCFIWSCSSFKSGLLFHD